MESNRYTLFCELMDMFDNGIEYVLEYDSFLHDYNGVILYQAESQIIKLVGNRPGITASELAKLLNKTNSACSQLIRKLRKKGWIYQNRNESNNREYNLFLTEEGYLIYKNHQEFEKACYERIYSMLGEFDETELNHYIQIQKKLNEAFRLDVEESRSLVVESE